MVQWSIGVVEAPIADFLGDVDAAVHWMPVQNDRFFADPFAVGEGDEVWVYAEEFRYAEGRARISALRYSGGRFHDPARAQLCREHHISYPFVVHSPEGRFVLPETAAAREIALYAEGNRGLRRMRTLVPDFAGLDPTLMWFDGRWWLFATDGSRADTDALHLFVSTNLWGPYRSHPLNPVREGRFGVRPAGTPFFHEGFWYRPAQDGTRRYGAAVVIQRITKLSEDHFAEEPARVVGPRSDGPFPDGLHTLAAVGDWTLIDGYRRVAFRDSPGWYLRRRGAAAWNRVRQLVGGRA